MSGQVLLLDLEGNLIEQVLNKSERAQKAADKSAQQNAEQGNESEYIQGNTVGVAADDRLQGTNRTGSDRTRAGIAVQSGNTQIFSVAGIDLAGDITAGITVGKGKPFQ